VRQPAIPDDWTITVVLADAAQVSDGKLSILGGGWQVIRSLSSPTALAILVTVPWAETNRKHTLLFSLKSEDGSNVEVMAPTPQGVVAMPVQIKSEFEIGRPVGFASGSRFNVPIAVMIGPLPVNPGRYEWTWTLDGETREGWNLTFDVRPQG
jgi:hypothetical protein